MTDGRARLEWLRQRVEKLKIPETIYELGLIEREQTRLLVEILAALHDIASILQGLPPTTVQVVAPPPGVVEKVERVERVVRERVPPFATPAGAQRIIQSVLSLPAPVDMVAAKRLDVKPDEYVKYDLSMESDLLIIYPRDDAVCYSTNIFTKPQDCFYLMKGIYQVLARPKKWERIFLQADTTETYVFVSEWKFVG